MELATPRRGMKLLAFTLAFLALAVTWLSAPKQAEAAKVANPGSFTATVSTGTIRIKTQTFNFDESSGDPITFTGTVNSAGTVNIPTSGVNFPPFALSSGGFDLTIRIIPTAAVTGTLNPLTGATSLRLQVYIKIDGVPLGGGCAIGSTSSPIDVNALITGTTSPPGPNTPITGTPLFKIKIEILAF